IAARPRGSPPAGWARGGARADAAAAPRSPRGSASPAPQGSARRVVELLSEAQCMELLAPGGVGRLVSPSRFGPTALPVIYKIHAGSIVLATWDPVIDED